MPKFAANLFMLYPELDFLDRFEASARDGFKTVEYLFSMLDALGYRPKAGMQAGGTSAGLGWLKRWL